MSHEEETERDRPRRRRALRAALGAAALLALPVAFVVAQESPDAPAGPELPAQIGQTTSDDAPGEALESTSEPAPIDGLSPAIDPPELSAGDTDDSASESDDETNDASESDDSPRTEAPRTDAIRERLIFLLSGYEYFPSRETLDELAAPSRIAELGREFARSTERSHTLRLRAVDMLGFYDDDATVGYLRSLVADPPEDLPAKQQRIRRLMRHHAMTSLARSQGARALDDLRPLLDHGDLQLRLSAISAIGKHGGAKGRELLIRRATQTDHRRERGELRKYVELP
jgi:hypothetical protein